MQNATNQLSLNIIAVGSRVRSFDFEGRELDGERACYVEGTVESVGKPPRGVAYVGHDVYAIRVERVVFGGEELPEARNLGELVCPPVNGIPKMFGGHTDGVTLIG